MNKIETLITDNRADSYLIFYVLATIILFGFVYGIVSDLRDMFKPIDALMAPMGGEYNDAESQQGFDFLNLLLSFSIVFFIIGIIWYAFSKAQVPNEPYQ